MYNFDDQLKIGERGEKTLDNFFTKFYEIHSVPLTMQRLGVDRVFVNRKVGARFSVEYKTDLIASTTHNFFFETRVNDKAGWVLSTIAQLVVYYVPPFAYVLDAILLRQDYAKGIIQGEQSKPVQNEGFTAEGLLVPISSIYYPVLVTTERVGPLK